MKIDVVTELFEPDFDERIQLEDAGFQVDHSTAADCGGGRHCEVLDFEHHRHVLATTQQNQSIIDIISVITIMIIIVIIVVVVAVIVIVVVIVIIIIIVIVVIIINVISSVPVPA